MVDPPARTPPRRPQISREYVEAHRRRRYVDAAAELLHEFGRQGPSVTNIVRLAGSARNSFYEVFRSGEDCIGYGIGVAVGELFATLASQDGEGDWEADVGDAIAGFYAAVAADPVLAELFLVHAAASRVEHGREAALAGAEGFAALFARGRLRAEALGRRPPPLLVDECLSRAIVSLAARRVRSPQVAGLPAEARPMAALVVGYYVGSEAAAEAPVGPLAAPTSH